MSARRTRKASGTMLFLAEYVPEEWPQLLATAEDRDKLEATHAEWLQGYREYCHRLRKTGQECHPVVIRMAEFLAWCARKGRVNDGRARVDYVIEKGRELYADGR